MERWASGFGVLLLATLAACGGGTSGPFSGTSGDSAGTASSAVGGTLDPSGPGGTGTVPVPGPADGLTWTPAESPDPVVQAELISALEELSMVMIVPTSPPPNGETVEATFNSMGFGRPTGNTLPGSAAQIWLEVRGVEAFAHRDRSEVVVSSPSASGCPEGARELMVRNDPGACAGLRSFGLVVNWREAGHSFSAVFPERMATDEALAWLETWRLLP